MFRESGQPIQLFGGFRPFGFDGQRLRGKFDHAGGAFLFPRKVSPSAHSQLFSCPFLRPSQAIAPEFQFKSAHIRYPQSERNAHASPHYSGFLCNIFTSLLFEGAR
nr:MAG TPA_asm: hypothetical protein [Caudoviricetes sp.]